MDDPEKPAATEKEKTRKSKYQEIQDMAVPEKIRLAIAGDKEARSLLIKDANKQVQEAVLKNLRITESEIVTIANSRSISEEMLRQVSDSRQWMKSYQVRLALVNNPKTPVHLALKLVNGLMVGDLKRLAKSKGVANVLATTAQRILIKKGS